MNAPLSSTKVVILSQSQAYALLKFFDGCLRCVEDRDHGLTEIHQRLSDSFWLARWLRKNVPLELRAVDIVDLSEALIVRLDELPWSDGDCETLRAIVRQLTMSDAVPDHSATFLAVPSTAAISSHYCDV